MTDAATICRIPQRNGQFKSHYAGRGLPAKAAPASHHRRPICPRAQDSTCVTGSIPAHVAPPTEPRFSPPSLGLPFCLPQLGGDEFSIPTLKHVCVTNYDANNLGFSASGPTSRHGTLGGALGSREVGDHLQLVCVLGAGFLVSAQECHHGTEREVTAPL